MNHHFMMLMKMYIIINIQFEKLKLLKDNTKELDDDALLDLLRDCDVVIDKKIKAEINKLKNKKKYYCYEDLFNIYYSILKAKNLKLLISNNEKIDDIIYKKYMATGKVSVELIKAKDIQNAINNPKQAETHIFMDTLLKNYEENKRNETNFLLSSQLKIKYAGYLFFKKVIRDDINMFKTELNTLNNIGENFFKETENEKLDEMLMTIRDDCLKLGIYITTIEIITFLDYYNKSKKYKTICDFYNDNITKNSEFSVYYTNLLYYLLRNKKTKEDHYCNVCLTSLDNTCILFYCIASNCAGDDCINRICSNCIMALQEPYCKNCFNKMHQSKFNIKQIIKYLKTICKSFSDNVPLYSLKQLFAFHNTASVINNVLYILMNSYLKEHGQFQQEIQLQKTLL